MIYTRSSTRKIAPSAWSYCNARLTEQLSPDEAKVNDLKRIVVACGVRKQWCVTTTYRVISTILTNRLSRYEICVLIPSRSKEFADCPTVPVFPVERAEWILRCV